MSARLRFVIAAALVGAAAFLAGTRFITPRGEPWRHPLTGRPVAGVATDARWMDRAERDAEEQPERALDLIGVAPGLVVADVGAGSGYMTLRLARRVGPTGRVYANDIQPRLLGLIEDKARAAGVSNIVPIVGREDDTLLPERTIDLALLVDVYHEFRRPQTMLQSIRRSLVPGGRLVLIEYREEDPALPIAPTHRMSVAKARTEVEAEGFTMERAVEDLPRQHILVFRRAVP
ncbi:MAG: methyltransferase domain-containing protein [Acidobacteriota bacterium]